MKQFWITPPAIYASLDDEFHFDFDPCPCPRPQDYNSLVLPWGKSNYVNPPFLHSDAPHGGPAGFARKAIFERDRGNTSVLILPVPWSIGLLMAAGAEIRYGGKVQWLEVSTGESCPRKAPQIIAVLRGKDAPQNAMEQNGHIAQQAAGMPLETAPDRA